PHTFTQFLRDSTLECYGAGAQGGTRDRLAAAHDMGGIYLALGPAQQGNDDYTAIVCQAFNVACDVVSCHHIEDNVHTPTVSGFLHLFDEILLAVIDAHIGAQGFHRLGAVTAAGREIDG